MIACTVPAALAAGMPRSLNRGLRGFMDYTDRSGWGSFTIRMWGMLEGWGRMFDCFLKPTTHSTIIDFKMRTYRCIGIGDTCFFQVRRDDLILSFPVQKAVEFSNSPFLLATKDDYDKELKALVHEKTGMVEEGDYLLFMSDALALWFLSQYEKFEKPWNVLLSLSENKAKDTFESWLNELRKSKLIKDDDTTLTIIEIV